MGMFILRRVGVMLLTAICLTYIVFFMTNLYPNLEKLAKTQGNFRMSDEAVASFLERGGYLQSTPKKYMEWIGVVPSYRYTADDGTVTGRCILPGVPAEE
ncbi:MAG: ABC transporter permease, partial [Pseudomonadota bacterium]